MRNQFVIPACMAIGIALVGGCKTPPGADGPPIEGLELAPFVIIGAIIVSPVYIADKGWEMSSDGLKTHVYAAPGTSLGDFERAIDRVEGGTCQPEIVMEPNYVERFKYRGKQAVYYGRFVGGLAIKY